MPSLIEKAVRSLSNRVQKASRGTLSEYVYDYPHEYGQPNLIPGDADGLISPERMREISKKTPTLGACLNAILDYTTNVNILIRNVDAALPADPAHANILKDILDYPNAEDTKRQLLSALIRDIALIGYGALEIEPNYSGNPANLHVVDSARLKIDYDEHGTILGYNMLDILGLPIHGRDGVHTWMPHELIFFRRDTKSESKYPESRLFQLFSCAILESLMLAFVGGKFTESNIPYGIYNMGDISDMELKTAISSWNAQAKNNHKIIITGGRGATNWTEFGYALKDLDATALLQEVRGKIMAILGVTMNELGESQDVNKSNGYNLSYTFKRRAIEPIMSELCSTLNKKLVREGFGFTDLELYYDEIDSRDELLQAQIDDMYLKNGVYSPNHIANRKGLPSVEGGDDRMFVLGTNAVPLDMLRPLAQAQLEAIQAEVIAIKMGGQSGAEPPAIRGPQSPIKQQTPDGQGSSQMRITYPKAQTQQRAAPKPTRGPTQSNQAAGMRQ